MSDSAQLFEELTAFCGSDSLSEIGLREIIEQHHGATPDNDHAFFLEVCQNEKVTEGIL